MKTKLSKEVWSKKAYYELIDNNELSLIQPGMEDLSKLTRLSKKVLDLGCGNGNRLDFITTSANKSYGVDISKTAIMIAKKKYPKLNFRVADLECLPYKDNYFDIVYSFYVFEHLDNPEKVLKEAARVLKKDGHVIIVAPNYGSPNRVSPPSTVNRINKLLRGIINDFVSIVSSRSDLRWDQVTPIANDNVYEIDWDTTVEPYISSLLKYMKTLQFKIEKFSTCFTEELPNAKFHQRIFKVLSDLGIYPFTRWGPVFYVIAKK